MLKIRQVWGTSHFTLSRIQALEGKREPVINVKHDQREMHEKRRAQTPRACESQTYSWGRDAGCGLGAGAPVGAADSHSDPPLLSRRSSVSRRRAAESSFPG